MIVAGIDGYGRGAWVAVVLQDGRYSFALPGRSLAALLPRLKAAHMIGIDIPIGLPDGPQPRRADLLARQRLRGRASTVFLTPPRPVLEAPTFIDANRIAVELTGKGVSLQAYGIRARILEADAFARADPRICEVHPEVSFASLNAGQPLADSKDSWVGAPCVGACLPQPASGCLTTWATRTGCRSTTCWMRPRRHGLHIGSRAACRSRCPTRLMCTETVSHLPSAFNGGKRVGIGYVY